jgi:hypothetical protein
MPDRERGLTPSELNAQHALQLLMRVFDLTDAEVAERLAQLGGPTSKQAVHYRRTGRKAIDLRDVEELSQALRVPPDVFRYDPVDVLKWAADNRPEQVVLSLSWIGVLCDCAA